MVNGNWIFGLLGKMKLTQNEERQRQLAPIAFPS